MSHKQKALIVDDEPRNQRIVSEILDGVVEFQVANTGEEAMKLLETGFWDLVLLDIMMPGMSGYDVCKKIRENKSLAMTKVILVSGKAMIEERLKGYEVGADDYMTKPFIPEELLAKAKVFLRLCMLERELSEMNEQLDKKVQERTKQLLDAEARLVTSAKMSALGEMAGGMAHEINTPLGTIGLISEQMAELVNDEQLDRETMKGMMQTVSNTVQRISSIINGLRMFSRDGSQDRLDLTSLKSIVDGTLALCQEKVKHGGVRLEVDPIPADLMISCRATQISQVLLNLISNACDAIMVLSEKWIKISLNKQTDGMIQLFVTDSGQGVPKEIQDKLFQPFFTTKDVGRGTGLGLSIAKGIMESHNGNLSIDSQCANTRFVLTLPGREPASPDGKGHGEKVA